MKYPQQQFEALAFAIQELNKYINVKDMQPNQLHTLIYCNKNIGQRHNKTLINPNTKELAKEWQFDKEICEDLGKKLKPNRELFIEILNEDNSFLNYPEGCNDNHIETAVKKIQKTL